MAELPKIVLKSGKDQSVMRYHPWIFSGAIKKIYGEPEEGCLVKVYNNRDEFLAIGHYQKSSIAVRVIDFKPVDDLPSLYRSKISGAFRLRKNLGLVNSKKTNAYRLINAEGDGIPGLIIDYYDGNLVMQMHSVGIFRDLDMIIEALGEIEDLKINRIYNKSESTLPFKAKTGIENGFLSGKPGKEEWVIREYDNNFLVDIEHGQKTGFFIDQRENRKLLGYFSEGRKVLNMFGYTGGFSIYALKGGADLVHTVDASARAAELSTRNVELNFSKEKYHHSFAKDVYDFFDKPPESYNLIILDPPAFAKHHNVLNNALQGYKKINRKAIELIEPGGIIFTFSCSQVVSRENFRKSVFTAAANTGRNVRILHQLSQPPDHPVSIYHPEGEYLKGLVLQVD